MPIETPYSIADLARLTGTTVRTIRYYLAQGLLPASGESGPGAHYGEGHLDRLRLTRRLQEQHLPLAEIRVRLAAMTDEDVAVLASEPFERETPATSALDYVRNLLGPSSAPIAPTAGPAPSAPPVAAASRALLQRSMSGPFTLAQTLLVSEASPADLYLESDAPAAPRIGSPEKPATDQPPEPQPL